MCDEGLCTTRASQAARPPRGLTPASPQHMGAWGGGGFCWVGMGRGWRIPSWMWRTARLSMRAWHPLRMMQLMLMCASAGWMIRVRGACMGWGRTCDGRGLWGTSLCGMGGGARMWVRAWSWRGGPSHLTSAGGVWGLRGCLRSSAASSPTHHPGRSVGTHAGGVAQVGHWLGASPRSSPRSPPLVAGEPHLPHMSLHTSGVLRPLELAACGSLGWAA